MLNWLHRALYTWVLKTAEYRDSLISLGNLLQCLTALTVKNFFLMSSRKLTCLNLCSCHIYITPYRAWFCLLNNLPWGIEVLLLHPPTLLLLQPEQARLLQPLLTAQVLQPPDHLGSFPLDLLNLINSFLVCSSTKMDTIFYIWPNKYQEQGNNHFLWSTGYIFVSIAQLAVHLHWSQGTLLIFSLFSTRTPSSFSAEQIPAI